MRINLMRAITVCVDYSDIASISISYNHHNFTEICIVTSPKDTKTLDLIEGFPSDWNVRPYVTDAFYRGEGAQFRKWLALEEALDWFGRHGWLTIMDVDILWPKNAGDVLLRYLRPGFLYTPLRRMLTSLDQPLPPENQWNRYPIHQNIREWAGYSQTLHCNDPVLGQPPWHDTSWKTAGSADSFFQAKWPSSRKVRPPFQVLHLGESGVNWCGRSSPYLDGSLPENAEERKRMMRDLWDARKGRTGDARFWKEKM